MRPFRVTGIDISTYLVKDAERAKRFYRDVLGLTLEADYAAQGGEFALPDGSTFGLFEGGAQVPWRQCTGVMFAVDDIDGAVAAVRTSGAPMNDAFETPVCFMAVGEDSEGNMLILHKRKA